MFHITLRALHFPLKELVKSLTAKTFTRSFINNLKTRLKMGEKNGIDPLMYMITLYFLFSLEVVTNNVLKTKILISNLISCPGTQTQEDRLVLLSCWRSDRCLLLILSHTLSSKGGR